MPTTWIYDFANITNNVMLAHMVALRDNTFVNVS